MRGLNDLRRRWKRAAKVRLFARVWPASSDEASAAQSVAFLGEMCRERSVALVGNAQSLLSSTCGVEIDSHDVVVRMNHGFVQSTVAAQGARTDIVALAAAVPALRLARRARNARLLWCSPEVKELSYGHLALSRRRLAFAPRSVGERLSLQLGGARPSTGLLMVALLLDAEPARLRLFGFDWKRTRTFYRDKLTLNGHDWDGERRLILGLAESSAGRLTLS